MKKTSSTPKKKAAIKIVVVKKRKKILTTKQQRVVSKIIENNGNVSKSMREVGYTDATARNPKNLIKSAGFQAAAKIFIQELENEKKQTLKMIKEKRKDANFGELSNHLDRTIKQIQLLEGKPTGIISGVDEIFKSVFDKTEGIPKND